MNKSEELVRLLGIEPIFRIKGLDWFNFKTTEHALEFIEKQKNALYERGLIFSEKDIYKVYPDFTKPSNFVKLLKLKCGNSSVLSLGMFERSKNLNICLDDIENLENKYIGFLTRNLLEIPIYNERVKNKEFCDDCICKKIDNCTEFNIDKCIRYNHRADLVKQQAQQTEWEY